MKLESIITFTVFNLFLFGTSNLSAEIDPRAELKILREVAITMDALELNDQKKIIAIYKKFGVKGTFAINEKINLKNNSPREIVDGMKLYLAEGFTIINHTATHRDTNLETVEEFKRDVIEGEKLLNQAISESGFQQTKYFRFPFLSRGKTQDNRIKIDEFLSDRGYKIAPVTIDTIDWKFSEDYTKAIGNKDTEKKLKIENTYLDFTKRVIARQELWSDFILGRNPKHILGRNPKHILLVHGSRITLNNLEKILTIFQEAGYKFISLDEAIEDDIYKIDTVSRCNNCSVGTLMSHLEVVLERESFINKNRELFTFPSY